MKLTQPFPNGELSPILALKGWTKKDILDIREELQEEIKRQNEEEHHADKSV